MLQRFLLKNAGRTSPSRAGRPAATAAFEGAWRWAAAATLALWLFLTVIVPLSGIALRAFVSNWGEGVNIADVLTLDHFREVFSQPTLVRGILNTVLIGVIGGALCRRFLHRDPAWPRIARTTAGRASSTSSAGCSCLRARPPGPASPVSSFLWVFLCAFPPLAPLPDHALRPSLWLAYSVVWLAYGMRLVLGRSLLQVGQELEEAAAQQRGATPSQVSRQVTLPLIRYGT